jgi:hypothetical protein
VNTHEVLVRARALIERGWAPWACAGRDGRYCALGAIAATTGGWNNSPPPTRKPALEALAEASGRPLPLVPAWNDSHQTRVGVLAAFDKAIAATAPEPDTDWLNEVRVEEPVAS